MSFPQIREELFEGNGAGPKLRGDMIPVDGETIKYNEESGKIEATDGTPLLKIDFYATTLAMPGMLRIDSPTGQLEAEAWPHAAAEVYRRYAAGDAFMVTETAWQADVAANGGVTSKFSIGDGSTWFRVPIIEKRSTVSAKDSAAGVEPGQYLYDRMRAIHGFPTGVIFSGVSPSGAIKWYGPTSSAPSGTTGQVIELDSTLLGPNYSGDKTHGDLMVWVPYIKLYGTVREASEANVAALVAGLTGKLDVAQYEADATFRIDAYGLISGDGAIVEGENITGSTRPSTGTYNVSSPAITLTSIILINACYGGPGAANGGQQALEYYTARRAGVFQCSMRNTASAVANGAFEFAVLNKK